MQLCAKKFGLLSKSVNGMIIFSIQRMKTKLASFLLYQLYLNKFTSPKNANPMVILSCLFILALVFGSRSLKEVR